MTFVALSVAVYTVTGSAGAVGLVLGVSSIPRFVLALPAGVWTDRLPRARILQSADVVRAAAQGLIAVGLLTGRANLALLLVAATLYGAATAFVMPASLGLVKEIVPDEQLRAANALVDLSRSTLGIVGPALAGLIFAVADVGLVYLVDAATFVCNVAALAMLGSLGRAPARDTTMVKDLREGWGEVRSRPWLWISLVYSGTLSLLTTPVIAYGPVVATTELGGAWVWALSASFGSVGAVIGGLVALRFELSRPLWALAAAGAGTAVQLAALAGPAPVPAVLASATLAMFTIAAGNTYYQTLLQRQLPNEVIGRVGSYDYLAWIVTVPVGFGLGSVLSVTWGVSPVLWLSAALLGGATLVAAVIWRFVQPAPEPEREATPATAP